MLEVLSSIPGFSVVKPRKRPGSKRLSAAAQLQQAKVEGCIDLETPDSVLTQINLRSLLNKETFSMLPRLYQHKLVQMLPQVDRESLNETQSDFRFVHKISNLYIFISIIKSRYKKKFIQILSNNNIIILLFL